MIVFLDFDGVLHPDAVYLRLNGQVELRAEGALFMWADRLAEALQPHPGVRIVLSTSWVRNIGFHRARKALPADLADRVVGATWHSVMGKGWPDYIPWDNQTRFEQIAAYLSRLPAPVPWLAIDDDDRGWPDAQRSNLVHTDGMLGLSAADVQAELISRLQRLNNALHP
uniref:HAD domain-containing protein n=1 Tax=Pseudomonas sp. LM8 TaxID=545908 RepID=UPI00156448FF|nr:HAD domain-containing protein [Pseudomonas sp. LM8]